MHKEKPPTTKNLHRENSEDMNVFTLEKFTKVLIRTGECEGT
jgi:hypothetical protein